MVGELVVAIIGRTWMSSQWVGAEDEPGHQCRPARKLTTATIETAAEKNEAPIASFTSVIAPRSSLRHSRSVELLVVLTQQLAHGERRSANLGRRHVVTCRGVGCDSARTTVAFAVGPAAISRCAALEIVTTSDGRPPNRRLVLPIACREPHLAADGSQTSSGCLLPQTVGLPSCRVGCHLALPSAVRTAHAGPNAETLRHAACDTAA